MFDFNTLAEFSRHYCIAICAFLVPANLVATSLTASFTLLRRPATQVWQAAGIASIFALVMILHVFTWFMVGMVMAPTYILLCLGSICLCANLGAILLRGRLASQISHYLLQ
jgi:phosphoglycerol transferase MdoB-like AlkP superfamily enzyme